MAYNKDYADYAKKGEYPPEFRDNNRRLGDISFQLNRIANLLVQINQSLKND